MDSSGRPPGCRAVIARQRCDILGPHLLVRALGSGNRRGGEARQVRPHQLYQLQAVGEDRRRMRYRRLRRLEDPAIAWAPWAAPPAWAGAVLATACTGPPPLSWPTRPSPAKAHPPGPKSPTKTIPPPNKARYPTRPKPPRRPASAPSPHRYTSAPKSLLAATPKNSSQPAFSSVWFAYLPSQRRAHNQRNRPKAQTPERMFTNDHRPVSLALPPSPTVRCP
jgi:hypothetical protein